jgi:hypothetical protein
MIQDKEFPLASLMIWRRDTSRSLLVRLARA